MTERRRFDVDTEANYCEVEDNLTSKKNKTKFLDVVVLGVTIGAQCILSIITGQKARKISLNDLCSIFYVGAI
jgi:hypothetical protein